MGSRKKDRQCFSTPFLDPVSSTYCALFSARGPVETPSFVRLESFAPPQQSRRGVEKLQKKCLSTHIPAFLENCLTLPRISK